jgi:alcohol dehydrogenase YqhD (iron-dependent ADH family)
MENFTIYNPVKLHFGKGVLSGLKQAARDLGGKALLVYGKGSVQKNGSLQQTLESLMAAGVEVFEYHGIKSNPLIEDVDKAADLGRKNNVDMIVAVGGGSVIDSAKMISITIPADHSGWDFADGGRKPGKAVPLIAVLTLAATGTEMNPYAVVQSHQAKKKIGYGHKLMFPRHSFLDPTFTLSVPAEYTSYGITDLVAHCLEAWFGDGEATLSDRFTLSIIREALKNGPLLMENLQDYDLRAKIMYAATAALNGLTSYGRKSTDWGVHAVGHCLSLKYDIPHGASLSIAYPAWLKLHKNRIPKRILELGSALFSVNNEDDSIYKLEYFFKVIGSPVRLSQMDIIIDQKQKDELLEIMKINKVDGYTHKLSHDDYIQLIDLMK